MNKKNNNQSPNVSNVNGSNNDLENLDSFFDRIEDEIEILDAKTKKSQEPKEETAPVEVDLLSNIVEDLNEKNDEEEIKSREKETVSETPTEILVKTESPETDIESNEELISSETENQETSEPVTVSEELQTKNEQEQENQIETDTTTQESVSKENNDTDEKHSDAFHGENIFSSSQDNESKENFRNNYSPANTGNENILIQPKKSHKSALIGIGIGLLIFLGVYLWGVTYYRNRFFPHTYIAGYNMSNMSLEDSLSLLEDASKEKTLVLHGKDGQEATIEASQIGLVLTDSPDIEETFVSQNVWAWPLNLVPGNETRLDSGSSLDENALMQIITTIPIVTGDQVVKTENARAQFDGNEYSVKDEVYGTEVNIEALKNNVIDGFLSGKQVLDLEDSESYVMPITLSDNKTLKESIDHLNSVKDEVITYDFQINQETLDKNTFGEWLKTDDYGNAYVDQALAGAYVADLANRYDTVNRQVPFVTSSGNPIEFKEEYGGWMINQEQETQDLQTILLAGESLTKEPVYSKTGRPRSENNALTGTYLEISISDQHMWYYKNGELIVDTPVVTGNTAAGHGTPTGLYSLQDKDMYVTLTDNRTYWSPVTFWMPFNGGIGVHDSSWRSSYGGRIYRGNGSHGCVNTPYSAAKVIYNNIEVGEPVAVY